MRGGSKSTAVIIVTAIASLVGAGAIFAGAGGDPSEWTTYGGSTSRVGYVMSSVSSAKRHFVVPVSGRVTGQVLAADGLYFATTTAGEVVAFDRNGFVHWRDDFGQFASSCKQLDGYGIVGTGVIDTSSHTLYVADAFGRLHALALSSGLEREGWPVRLLTRFDRQLNWGALTLVGGSVYVPTAAYCDTPGTPGTVRRVDIATRTVTFWRVVPLSEGGGGGPWGWGGLAYDPDEPSLYVATSGAFPGGSNAGDAYTETAGYGDRIVRLGLDLSVQDSSHPEDLPDTRDYDFVGSPLLVSTAACGKLVVAATKNDTVYGWKQDALGGGPLWVLHLEDYVRSDPYVGQLAWSPRLSSFYAVTGTQFVRISIGADCTGTIVWQRPLATQTENGSPTVVGDTVWFADNGKKALVAYSARTGVQVFQAPLGGTTVEAPTVVPGRVIVGTFSGVVDGFDTGGPASSPLYAARQTISWADGTHGWKTRADGVYATENAGRTWRRIYDRPAFAILRLSKDSGVIATGSRPSVCMCTTRQLWTANDGRTWHEAPALTGSFLRSGSSVYFWSENLLRLLGPIPTKGVGSLKGTTLASVADGRIVSVAPIAGGVAALVSSRVAGQGWDTTPRVILVENGTATTVALPEQPGLPLARTIAASGATLTVTAIDFNVEPAATLTWTSRDGGMTWSVGS